MATDVVTAPSTPTVMDPIDLEVLRSRLETIGEQAAAAVEHTAISPTVTESKDYSVTLVDAEGGLIVGTGMVLFHFGAATHAVRSTLERYGDTIAPGDVFMANDPHDGGGLHPQDVMVQRPVFFEGELVAWVGISAHMMDVGGMVVGSFAPDATECYQEGLRLPPVRLFRRGEEITEVFDIIRTNVRMAQLVEMDLRGLVAGCHLANERVEAVVAEMGGPTFAERLRAIRDLTEAEMRRRISALEDGVYRTASWTEFAEELYHIPCTLTVDGDRLIFDFEGASAQTTHFFNSKPYIIESELAVMLSWRLGLDLPFNEGIFAAMELRCPEGTIVNARPPAPIAAAHMHVGLNAADVAIQAVSLAIGASPRAEARSHLHGPGFESAIGNGLWSWVTPEGETDAYIVLDGNWVGGSAGVEHDGHDLGRNLVGTRIEGSFADIEILESWYPLLFKERAIRQGSDGAGAWRAGGGNQYSFRPYGIPQMFGTMFGMRRWLPLPGAAGGAPGACTEFLVHRADGSVEQADVNASGVVVSEDDWFEMRLASGGGFGDPLDRSSDLVARDVAAGRFSAEDAAAIYGVILDGAGAPDLTGTEDARARLRRERLARAEPPRRVLEGSALAQVQAEVKASGGDAQPLQPGVVQRGSVAYAEASGTPLAIAPRHWSEGCAVLVEPRSPEGPPIVIRSYLDPGTGRSLMVEVVPDGAERSFEVSPRRWTQAR